jgi:hypothetical protein
MNDLIAGPLATRLTAAHLSSARPDAPVVDDQPRRRTTTAARVRTAARLHALARWVEPAPRRSAGVLG